MQRYNLSNVMLSKGEVVQSVEAVLPKSAATSSESLGNLVTVVAGFDREDPSRCTSIDAYPNEHVRCCGHQVRLKL